MPRLFEKSAVPDKYLQTMSWCWFAVLFVGAAIIGAWSEPHLNMALFQKTLFVECLLLFMLTHWCARQRFRLDQFEWILAPVNKPLLVILLWGFVSLTWSVYPDYTLVRLILWLASAAAFVLLIAEMRSVSEWDKLLLWLFISGVLISLVGISQHLLGFSLLPQTAPPASTFINKNIAVHIIVFALPVSVYLFLKEHSKPVEPLLIACATAVVAAYLIYTQTRGGWLAVGVEGIFIIFGLYARYLKESKLAEEDASFSILTKSHKRALFLGTLLFLVLVNASNEGFLAKGTLWKTLSSISEDAQRYTGQNTNARYRIWSETIQGIKQAPLLGKGLGTLEYKLPDQAGPEMHNLRRAHNDFLEFIYEMGLVGLGLILWLFIAIVRISVRLWRQLSGDHYLLFISLAAAIIGSAVNAFFSFPYTQAMPPVLLAVCLAGLVFLYQFCHPESKHKIYWPRHIWVGLIGLSAGVFVTVLLLNLQWLSYLNRIEMGIHSQTQNWQFSNKEQQQILVVHPEMVHTLNRLSAFSFSADRSGFMHTWNVGLAQAYLRFKPNDPQVYRRLISYHIREGEFEQAVLLGEQAMKAPMRGTKQMILPPMISALDQVGREEEAAKYYLQLVSHLITPEFVCSTHVVNDFVTINLPRNDEKNLYTILRKCVSDFPGEWQYQAILGVQLYKSGRTQEALPLLEKAMLLSPENPYKNTLIKWLSAY